MAKPKDTMHGAHHPDVAPNLPPAGQVAPSGDGRAAFFARLYVPMQNGTGKPENVKRKAA